LSRILAHGYEVDDKEQTKRKLEFDERNINEEINDIKMQPSTYRQERVGNVEGKRSVKSVRFDDVVEKGRASKTMKNVTYSDDFYEKSPSDTPKIIRYILKSTYSYVDPTKKCQPKSQSPVEGQPQRKFQNIPIVTIFNPIELRYNFKLTRLEVVPFQR